MVRDPDRTRPPEDVLTAFGADASPSALPGGRGRAWRAGAIVVKPADTSEEILAWQAGTLAEIDPAGLRVSLPLRSHHGSFVVDGWCATSFCSGSHEPGRWSDIIAAGERFHAAIARVAWPDFVLERDDPWSIADRAAWGEVPLAPYLEAPHVDRLASRLVPIAAASQVVHGDLTGNVLFADPLPPALIDLSIYCRPAAYASAIVVADAIAWEAATPPDFDRVTLTVGFGQLLARALLYRMITDWIVEPGSAEVRAAAYAPVVDLAIEAIERGERPHRQLAHDP